MTSTLCPRRYTAAEQAFIEHQDALRAFLNDRLPAAGWHRGEEVVQEVWLEALKAGLAGEAIDADSGLPGWLAAAARTVVRRRTHPVPARSDVRWELLTQLLGHSDTWPARWHDVLATGGQAALLKQAVADLARPRVVPLPSTVFARSRRSAAAAA